MYKYTLKTILAVTEIVSLVLIVTVTLSFAENQEVLKEMGSLIKKQQAQIDTQAKELESLSQKVDAMVESDAGEQPKEGSLTDAVTKNFKLYGQVNRGVLYSNDGNNDYVYQVDNSNSSTRIGIDAIAEKNGITTGAKIEVELQSNASSKVNQDDRRSVGDGYFEKRHMDVYIESDHYGKVSIGHGATASDGTSEVDLSGTSVVSYSSVSLTAGGQYFFNSAIDALDTDTTIGAVMNNMDGLSRDDRLRYDSPDVNGAVLSASYIANGGGDAALRYSLKSDSINVSAAISFANPGSTSTSIDDQFSGSVSAIHSSGINLTLSGGSQSYKNTGRDDGVFMYGKLGYKKAFFSVGDTALSLDYGIFDDLKVNNDSASTIGAAVVQNLRDLSTEIYLCYRFHNLDRDNADYDSINSVLSGFRVKF